MAGATLAVTVVPASGGPPVAPHVVTSLPQTDGVVLTEYATNSPVTVQVLRGGVVIGTSQGVTPIVDRGTTLAEVNRQQAQGSAGRTTRPTSSTVT